MVTEDHELREQILLMVQFAKKASIELGPDIFNASLREYKDEIRKRKWNPTVSYLEVADFIIDQIDTTVEMEEDSKEFYKGMFVVAAFQLMEFIDEDFNLVK